MNDRDNNKRTLDTVIVQYLIMDGQEVILNVYKTIVQAGKHSTVQSNAISNAMRKKILAGGYFYKRDKYNAKIHNEYLNKTSNK